MTSKLKKALQAIIEAQRGYADYWHRPGDKPGGELDVARTLHNFVVLSDDQLRGELTPVTPDDPPDVLLRTHTGRRISIEVTELVDSDAIKETRKRGQEILRQWTTEDLAKELAAIVHHKDFSVGDYEEQWLAIHTGETMITPELAMAAVTQLKIRVRSLNKAFLLLDYQPLAPRPEYPDGCVVLPIALRR